MFTLQLAFIVSYITELISEIHLMVKAIQHHDICFNHFRLSQDMGIISYLSLKDIKFYPQLKIADYIP